MWNHIFKRVAIFTFWFIVILVIMYVRTEFNKLGELYFELIFPTFLLIIFSAIFLLFESSELKKSGRLDLYKLNRIIGVTILSLSGVLILWFFWSAASVF
jgi:hypothetical protein